jgi:hypothetical protein
VPSVTNDPGHVGPLVCQRGSARTHPLHVEGAGVILDTACEEGAGGLTQNVVHADSTVVEEEDVPLPRVPEPSVMELPVEPAAPAPAQSQMDPKLGEHNTTPSKLEPVVRLR